MKMRVSQIGTMMVMATCLMGGFQNCGSTEMASRESIQSQPSSSHDEIEQNYKTLQDLAEENLSCRDVSDCSAVPVGSKPCGGPTGYLVVSLLNPKSDEINSLATQLSQLEREYNIKQSLTSTCDFEMPPDLACVQAQCARK